MQQFFVYILQCIDGSYYIGHTDDLEKRVMEHQNRILHCYTASRLPIKLVYHQEFDSREAAFAAERQLKGWSRKKKEALIKGDFAALRLYAKNRLSIK